MKLVHFLWMEANRPDSLIRMLIEAVTLSSFLVMILNWLFYLAP